MLGRQIRSRRGVCYVLFLGELRLSEDRRVSLHFKGLPFKTEWVEYPDIEPTLKRLGAPPTSKKPDGSDAYTLPAIYDDSTKQYISDSIKIAQYLDETYPDTPKLIPSGTRAAIEIFQTLFSQSVSRHLFALVIAQTNAALNERSEEYFRRTREAMFKVKLEEIAPAGPKREQTWETVKEGLGVIADALSKNGSDKLYYFGDKLSYADVIVASYLYWGKVVLEDNEEWKSTVEKWDDGRWAKLLDATSAYFAV